MKTGVYSLLFAINFLYESGVLPVSALLGGSVGSAPVNARPEISTVPTINPQPSAFTCLSKSFADSNHLLLTAGMMVCQYDQGLGTTLNDDNLEDFFKIINNTLTSTLCAVDDVMQTADTLKQPGTPTFEVVTKIIEFLRPVLDNAGLSPSLLNTLCNMLEPALTPSCVPALLAGDPVKLITDMKLQACQGQNEQILYKDLTAVLSSLGCLLKDPVGRPTLPSVAVQDPKEASVVPTLPSPVSEPGLKEPISDSTVPLPVSEPDLKEPISVTTVLPPAAVPDPKKPIAAPTLLMGIVKRDLGESNSLPNQDAPVVSCAESATVPDHKEAITVPTEHRKVIWKKKKYFKLTMWIRFQIHEEQRGAIKQKRPKDPEATVTCTAVDLLVKKVAPV